MREVEEERTFVLKDNRGNYVGSNSISQNKQAKQYVYSYSKFLTNGFYTYQTSEAAEVGLKILQDKETEINIGKEFHIEEINRYEVLKQESNINIPKNPFQHEYYQQEGLAIA